MGLQKSFLCLLFRYLRWKYGADNAKAWMEEGPAMMDMAREAYKITKSIEMTKIQEVEEFSHF